jgi:hypothetical protein
VPVFCLGGRHIAFSAIVHDPVISPIFWKLFSRKSLGLKH